MTERAGLEVDTLTIRIPMWLERRGGRKLIMTREGAAVPTPPRCPARGRRAAEPADFVPVEDNQTNELWRSVSLPGQDRER